MDKFMLKILLTPAAIDDQLSTYSKQICLNYWSFSFLCKLYEFILLHEEN